MSFAHPLYLWLAPLLLLPWLVRTTNLVAHPAIALAPTDPWSTLYDQFLRLLGSVVIAAIVLGLAGLFQNRPPVERISRGAEIVILLDKSRSMDNPLMSPDGRYSWGDSRLDSKSVVARRLLGEFVAGRPEDRFAFMLFSTLPIPVIDLTGEHAAIQSAIAASSFGRGLSETDLGLALPAALNVFRDRPYIGSRIVLLVSDGGAHLDVDTRAALVRQLRKERAAIYWIYLRSFRSPGLMADKTLSDSEAESVPEHFLHKFFQSTGAAYRAYEAENPDSMQRAIADIARLENRPLRYVETVPRVELDRLCYLIGLSAAGLLALLQWLNLRGVRPRPASTTGAKAAHAIMAEPRTQS